MVLRMVLFSNTGRAKLEKQTTPALDSAIFGVARGGRTWVRKRDSWLTSVLADKCSRATTAERLWLL